MFKKYQPAIIILTVLTLIIVGIVNYVQSLINQSTDSFSQNKSELLDNVAIPTEFEFKGAKIALAWTDDNTGEDLIIQSDKKEYYGFNQIDIYFSITNISKKNQEVNINFIGDRINLINLLRINNASALSAGLVESGETNYYKATLGFPTQTKGEFFIEAVGDKGGYGYLDPWYHSNWKYRREITINSNQVATTTSAFPILATTTLTDLKTAAHGGKVENDQGYDIVWTDTDGQTVLNYEQEKYASTTGEIVYWVKTDISSTTDKVLYMYYGNASASDLATTTGVWTNGFDSVFHLATTTDSTSNALHGTLGTGANEPIATSTACLFYECFDFDGNDHINIGGSLADDTWTAEAWIYLDSTAGDNIWYAHNGPNGIGTAKSGTAFIWVNDSYDVGAIPIAAGQWYYFAYIANGNEAYYVNMTKDTDITGNYGSLDIRNCIGDFVSWPGYGINGRIDEFRMSNVARSEAWLQTSYNNQSDVSSFMSFGDDKCRPTTQINTPITNKFKDSSLVGHWTFNGPDMDWGSSTAEALDRSGQGNNGDVIGAKAVIGKVGQGLEFDGDDDHVAVGDTNNSLDGINEVTLSLWFYPHSLASGWHIIAGKGNSARNYGLWHYGNRFVAIFYNESWKNHFSVNSYVPNQWYYLTITIDNINDTIRIYVNGVDDTASPSETADMITNDGSFYIAPLYSGNRPDGLIDEVRVYNRALSTDEIAEHYRAGARIMKIDPNKEYKTIIQP